MTKNEWDDFAAEWDVNADVREYSEKAFHSWREKVAPFVSDISGSRALDFGCGTGLLAEKLAEDFGQIIAVDSSPKMIKVFKQKLERSGVTNVVAFEISENLGSNQSYPHFADGFDLIVASSVCSFLQDYEMTLCDLTRLMKPDGWFIQWDWIDNMPEERIRTAFRAAGFLRRVVFLFFLKDLAIVRIPWLMGFPI